MTVVIVEPGRAPYRNEIEDTLEAMQSTVGGYIQAVYPFEEPVALVCAEEAKLDGLPPNRVLRDEEGRIYDIISGTFFLCSAPLDSENFESLTEEQANRYARLFQHPEVFLRVNGELVAIPIT